MPTYPCDESTGGTLLYTSRPPSNIPSRPPSNVPYRCTLPYTSEAYIELPVEASIEHSVPVHPSVAHRRPPSNIPSRPPSNVPCRCTLPYTSEASIELPVEASIEHSVEASIEHSVEASIELPVEASIERSVEASIECSVPVHPSVAHRRGRLARTPWSLPVAVWSILVIAYQL